MKMQKNIRARREKRYEKNTEKKNKNGGKENSLLVNLSEYQDI